MTVEHKG